MTLLPGPQLLPLHEGRSRALKTYPMAGARSGFFSAGEPQTLTPWTVSTLPAGWILVWRSLSSEMNFAFESVSRKHNLIFPNGHQKANPWRLTWPRWKATTRSTRWHPTANGYPAQGRTCHLSSFCFVLFEGILPGAWSNYRLVFELPSWGRQTRSQPYGRLDWFWHLETRHETPQCLKQH